MRISDVHVAASGGSKQGDGTTFLKVLTDEGAPGVGAAAGRDARLLDELCGPVSEKLVGLEASCVARVISELGSSVSGPALDATELALWDLIGNVTGAPLHRLWGGHAEHIQGFSTIACSGAAASVAAQAASLAGEGLSALVVELTDAEPRDALAPLRQIRERLGSSFTLAVIWKPGRSPVSGEAEQLIDELEELEVAWLECRLGPGTLSSLAGLHDRARTVQIVAGASDLPTLWQLVLSEQCDILRPDPRMGSMLTLWKAAALAESAGLQFMAPPSQTQVGELASLHLSLAVPSCNVVELTSPVSKSAAEPAGDGFICAPARPGLGLELASDLFSETHLVSGR